MLSNLLVARTRCHSTLPRCPSSSFRLRTPKPANPTELNPATSVVCLGNRPRQSQPAHLACFQRLSLEIRPFFSKRRMKRPATRSLWCNRHDMSCSPSHRVVTSRRAGHENIPTVEAGICFGIINVLGKSHMGPGTKLIGYRTGGKSNSSWSSNGRLSVPKFRLLDSKTHHYWVRAAWALLQ